MGWLPLRVGRSSSYECGHLCKRFLQKKETEREAPKRNEQPHKATQPGFRQNFKMGDSNFFKGTSADQDRRFADKESKLLKTLKFPPEFDAKVSQQPDLAPTADIPTRN